MTKVLLYTDSDGLGGIERHICDLAASLPSQQAEVAIVCRQSSELERVARAAGFDVLALATRRPYTLRASRQLAGWISSRQIDIIHAHNGRAAMIAVLAARKAGRGICIKSQHFLEPAHTKRSGPLSLVVRAVHRRVNRAIRGWIAVSHAARTCMLDRREAPHDRITVIPNGIKDPDRRQLREPVLERQGLRIAAEAPMAVCAARLEPEKDVASLIEAWKEVAQAIPEARCVIVGAGSQERMLKELVVRADLNEKVYLAGFRNDALSVINAADLLVLPSLAEPFGLVLLEAMSLSKPVVATKAGGPLEIVEDGKTGLLVPSSDPKALAASLIQLLRDRALRERFGQNGRDRFTRHFTTQRMSEATADVYRAAVSGKFAGSSDSRNLQAVTAAS